MQYGYLTQDGYMDLLQPILSVAGSLSPQQLDLEKGQRNKQLSKVDSQDEVEGERKDEDEVEVEREKGDRDRTPHQGYQGQVGEHHSGEDMEEEAHHQD